MIRSLLGVRTEPVVHTVDARWTMAHAASIGAVGPRYLDTAAPDGTVALPLFPVCVEWPAVQAALALALAAGLTRDEARRSVHATHDLTIHRLVRPGDVLTTTATVTTIEERRPGAFQELLLDTVDAAGAPIATTRMGSLFLGTTCTGVVSPTDSRTGDIPPPIDGADDTSSEIRGVDDTASERRSAGYGPRLLGRVLPIDAGLAHLYSEGSRIWNPIHTDAAVARRAGLPGPILHGTATLTLAVEELVACFAAGDPTRVRRVRGRFTGMVALPSAITVRAWSRVAITGGRRIAFDVADASGRTVLRDGLLDLSSPVRPT